MNFYKRFVKWLTEKRPVEESTKVCKVTIEFETGLVRTLEGEAARDWANDICYNMTARCDMSRHKWKEVWPKA